MDLKKVQPPLERQLALLGYELVHLETAREGRDEVLRLYIDHLDAETSHRKVTLDDCAAAHEGLALWMDVEFPDLREKLGVEVSSPGMERPLVKADHFRRFAGRLCRVQTAAPINGQKRFKGWIGPLEGASITLEEDGVLKSIPVEAIQKARLAPFDEEKTPRPKHLAGRFTDMNEGEPPGRFAASASPLVLPHVVSGPSPDTTSDIPDGDGVETSVVEDEEA